MATIPQIALSLLSGFGQGEARRRSILANNTRDDRIRQENFDRSQQLNQQQFENQKTLRNDSAAINALTQFALNPETQTAGISELNRFLGTDINIPESEQNGDIGSQIAQISRNPDLDDKQKQIELFKLAANNRGLSFSDVQKFIESPQQSQLLGEQIESQEALTSQRKASTRLSNARISKLKEDIVGNKPIKEMSIQELQETARKTGLIMNSVFDKTDFGSQPKEGLDDAANALVEIQDELIKEIKSRGFSVGQENFVEKEPRQKITIPGF